MLVYIYLNIYPFYSKRMLNQKVLAYFFRWKIFTEDSLEQKVRILWGYGYV